MGGFHPPRVFGRPKSLLGLTDLLGMNLKNLRVVTKVIIEKSRGEVSLMEQDTTEKVS